MRKFGIKNITAANQFFSLKSLNNKGFGHFHRGEITWKWSIKPTEISRTYQARLEWHEKGLPEVYIEEPDIVLLANGRPLPHVYNQEKKRLCLYLPCSGQWRADKFLSQTVIPWTSLWLFYYEEWLISDDWKGGGVHPGSDKSKIEADNKKSINNE